MLLLSCMVVTILEKEIIRKAKERKEKIETDWTGTYSTGCILSYTENVVFCFLDKYPLFIYN